MRNYLCIILFFVLSLTIPATSAYAYGGGGSGGGGGRGGAKSTISETVNPPSGFKPVKQESADGDSNVLQNISEIKPSSETDPGKEEEVAELVNEVNLMDETAEEGEVEGDSTDSAEGTTSDEKAPDEKTKGEDPGDKKNISEDGTDKTGDITIGVRRFLSQLNIALPQGMQPAVDAANRAERVKHVNNFFHELGLPPQYRPDLSDDKNLVKVENMVKKAEEKIAEQHDRQKNLAAAAEYEKPREELLRKREEQIQRSCEDARAVVKFLMDATVTFFTAGIGGLPGAGTSIAYSAATSDDPVKGGAVQTAVEIVTPGIVKIVKPPFGSGVLYNFAVNFGLTKTAEAADYGLGEVLERQQQRGQFESVPPSK